MSQSYARRTVVSGVVLVVLVLAGPAAAWGGLPTPPAAVAAVPYSWQIQSVAARGTAGLYNDLALAANGDPRISYFNYVSYLSGGRYQLMYSAWDGVRWMSEMVADHV